MSSRTPAPEDAGFPAMPDLPGDLFDTDESLYAPLDSSTGFHEDERGSRDEGSPIGGYPGYDDDVAGYADERPRRRSHSQTDDNVDVVPRGRRRREVEDDPIDRPRARRNTRRVSFDERESRQHIRRERGDVGGTYTARARIERSSQDAYIDDATARAPRRRNRTTTRLSAPSRQDRVLEQPRMQAEAATADIVTSIQPTTIVRAPAQPRVRRPRNPAWKWESIVLPQPRQMLEQAFPSLLMAASVLGTLGVMRFLPGGLPLWAPMIFIPTILLLFKAGQDVHPMWRRSALINLVVVGAFFPMMIVRQSFLRVPFVELGNGTLVMPVLATGMVVLAMVIIAVASAFLSQEDPEYSGMLFLPAALLVPFFAGATEITSLETALMILGGIYVVSGILTVVASMLPAAYPTLVAPVALALEFFILPVSEQSPIFPVGAGMSAKLLFFVVLFVGVGLTVAVPMLSVWVRQVLRIVRRGMRSQSIAAV